MNSGNIDKFVWGAWLTILIALPATGAPLRYTGVNLAGAEFGGTVPGTFGIDYTYPNQGEVDYFKGKGMNLVRLPFRWERLQQTTNANFNVPELNRLHTFVSATTAKGVYVILDPHNYARYYNNAIGVHASVPISAFSNFWSRLASIYRTNDHVIFGLMNEPNSMPTETWRDAANAAIAAIRAVNATNLILVPGNAWTGAHSWFDAWYGTPNATVMLTITDPLNHFAFEAHQYFDGDSSGSSPTCVSATIGVQRLTNFTAWCRNNGRRAFLGEFAGSTNALCLQTLENSLAYLEANADVWEGWTFWAAGPWWGDYMFTLEPVGGNIDRPQMNVLENHIPIPAPQLMVTPTNRFQFVALPGLIYQPERSSILATGSWANYGTSITGNGNTAAVPMNTATNTNGFYRVRVGRTP